jgi:uncharacterized membrane protein YbhN (UPF0104 family)
LQGGGSGLGGPLALSYLIAAGLLVSLVWAGGLWNLLANTRLLDLLIRSGVVALTDADAGFVSGVPDAQYYVASQDNVDWNLILIAAGILILSWLIRAVRFRAFARSLGIGGSFGRHAVAFFYGLGIDRFMPFNIGSVATASELAGQGTAPNLAIQAASLGRLFAGFEILTLAGVGLLTVGWATWLGQILWALVIVGVALLVVRGRRRNSEESTGFFPWARETLGVLAQRPGLFAKFVLLSVIAVLLEPVAAYVLSQAFTSPNVILNVEFPILLMAILCGHIAASAPLTPGALGQFEWGFAAAVYVGGTGIPEAVTIAILYGIVRYVAAGLVFGWAVLLGRTSTNIRSVLAGFRSGSLDGGTPA